jgi:hypothetical protein
LINAFYASADSAETRHDTYLTQQNPHDKKIKMAVIRFAAVAPSHAGALLTEFETRCYLIGSEA